MEAVPVAELLLYVDCVSPYSYFAYLSLQRYRPILHLHSIRTRVIPFFLGGARDGNGSPYQEPPAVKQAWGNRDLEWMNKILGVKVRRPERFPISSLLPVRVASYLNNHVDSNSNDDGDDDISEKTLVAFWNAYWCRGLDISSPEILLDVLRPIFPSSSSLSQTPEEILAIALSPANKKRTKEITDRLMRDGCFGAPWIVATNGDGETVHFWGNDRWDHVFLHLGVPFTGVMPLPPGMSMKMRIENVDGGAKGKL